MAARRRDGFAEIIDGVVQLGGDAARVGRSAHGGGVGVLATRDIAPGEIVIVEEAPLIAAQKSTREPLHMQVPAPCVHVRPRPPHPCPPAPPDARGGNAAASSRSACCRTTSATRCSSRWP